MRDTRYYDSESAHYSGKRYPEVPQTYVQSLFRRRLRIVLSLAASLSRRRCLALLEIGCADGVVTSTLYDEFPDCFARVDAVDISAKMIEAARANAGGRHITFALRDELSYASAYDLVVEVGVINYAREDEELDAARRHTGPNGRFLCSIAGSDSLKNRLKHDEAGGFNNFLTYAEYEKKIRDRFVIERVVPVGLFIPHIWKVPSLARIVQPMLETLLAPVAPNLFHEKVYLLKPPQR